MMYIALKSNLSNTLVDHDIYYLGASSAARLFSNGFSGGRRIRSAENPLSIPTAFSFSSITKGIVGIERSWRPTAATPKHLMLHRSAPPAKPARRSVISCCPNVDIVSGKVTTSPIYSRLLTKRCFRKSLTCVYANKDRRFQHDKHQSTSSTVLSASQSIPSEPAVADASLYRQVLQLIHQMGQLVDDLSARYFQGPHRYLPVCSRPYFYSNLITLGAIPSAEFSILLLTICLTVSAAHADQQSLRRTTNRLIALVRESYPTSIPLIQSRLLLAIYDYTHGRPEDAFQAISGCARMAYATRIHLHFLPACRKDTITSSANIKARSELDGPLQATEAANTWWGIIICER